MTLTLSSTKNIKQFQIFMFVSIKVLLVGLNLQGLINVNELYSGGETDFTFKVSTSLLSYNNPF